MISYFVREKSGQGQEPILMKKKTFENYSSLRWSSSTLRGVNLPRYFKVPFVRSVSLFYDKPL